MWAKYSNELLRARKKEDQELLKRMRKERKTVDESIFFDENLTP